jgi:uncharacterized repeat protein (TIGR01451 family)
VAFTISVFTKIAQSLSPTRFSSDGQRGALDRKSQQKFEGRPKMRSKIQLGSIGLSVVVCFLVVGVVGGAFEALAEITVIPSEFAVSTCVSGITSPRKLTIAPDGRLIVVDLDQFPIGATDTTPDYIRQNYPPCDPGFDLSDPQATLQTVSRDGAFGVAGVTFSSDGAKMFFAFSRGTDTNDGEIRVSSPPEAAPTVLKSGLIQPYGLALAPACFGDFSGMLIVADIQKGGLDGKGQIYAVNPETVEADVINVTALETILKGPTDLAFWPLFSPDCDLYVTVREGVVRVNSSGTVSLVKSLPNAFALAAHPVTGDLYVIARVSLPPGDPGHEIKKINPTTGESTTFAFASWASDLEAGELGGGGGSLIFSPDGSTLYVSEPGLDRVVKITGPFPSLPNIVATKEDSDPNGSPYKSGDTIQYTVVISNTGGQAMPDNLGDEFVDNLPRLLLLNRGSRSNGEKNNALDGNPHHILRNGRRLFQT